VINTVAQFAGLGLPPVLGAIKDSTGNYNGGLLLIAAALIAGGVLGLLITRNHRSHNQPTIPVGPAVSDSHGQVATDEVSAR
jgi:MFS transporter, ACS family, tartrate transporter